MLVLNSAVRRNLHSQEHKKSYYQQTQKNNCIQGLNFPGSPLVMTVGFCCRGLGHGVWGVGGTPRSHMPCGAAKKVFIK